MRILFILSLLVLCQAAEAQSAIGAKSQTIFDSWVIWFIFGIILVLIGFWVKYEKQSIKRMEEHLYRQSTINSRFRFPVMMCPENREYYYSISDDPHSIVYNFHLKPRGANKQTVELLTDSDGRVYKVTMKSLGIVPGFWYACLSAKSQGVECTFEECPELREPLEAVKTKYNDLIKANEKRYKELVLEVTCYDSMDEFYAAVEKCKTFEELINAISYQESDE